MTPKREAPRNSAAERRRVVRLMCSYAHDADDARQLCATAGCESQRRV